MKIDTPLIRWHNRQAIYSIDIHPSGRIATAGADKFVRIWRPKVDEEGNTQLEFLTELSKHTQPVNCVRFSPDGLRLATASDDGLVLIWSLEQPVSEPKQPSAHDESKTAAPSPSGAAQTSGEEGGWNLGSFAQLEEPAAEGQLDYDADNYAGVERWVVAAQLWGHARDVYNVAWSPDSTRLVTGSLTEPRMIVWACPPGEVAPRILGKFPNDHHGFVQGVDWDPLDMLLVSQGDTLITYRLSPKRRVTLPELDASAPISVQSSLGSQYSDLWKRCRYLRHTTVRERTAQGDVRLSGICECTTAEAENKKEGKKRSSCGKGACALPLSAVKVHERASHRMFLPSEKLNSFFRRLQFSPDGSFVVCVAGQFQYLHKYVVNKQGGASHTEDDSSAPPATGSQQSPAGSPTEATGAQPAVPMEDATPTAPTAPTDAGVSTTRSGRVSRKPKQLQRPAPSCQEGKSAEGSSQDCADAEQDPDAGLQRTQLRTMFNTVYMFHRDDLHVPVAHFPSSEPMAVCAWSPILYRCRREAQPHTKKASGPDSPIQLTNLPYRMVFALAGKSTLAIYDTEQPQPLALMSNLHYDWLTDLRWSPDGHTLHVASADGFVSFVKFDQGELGDALDPSVSAFLASQRVAWTNHQHRMLVNTRRKKTAGSETKKASSAAGKSAAAKGKKATAASKKKKAVGGKKKNAGKGGGTGGKKAASKKAGGGGGAEKKKQASEKKKAAAKKESAAGKTQAGKKPATKKRASKKAAGKKQQKKKTAEAEAESDAETESSAEELEEGAKPKSAKRRGKKTASGSKTQSSKGKSGDKKRGSPARKPAVGSFNIADMFRAAAGSPSANNKQPANNNSSRPPQPSGDVGSPTSGVGRMIDLGSSPSPMSPASAGQKKRGREAGPLVLNSKRVCLQDNRGLEVQKQQPASLNKPVQKTKKRVKLKLKPTLVTE